MALGEGGCSIGPLQVRGFSFGVLGQHLALPAAGDIRVVPLESGLRFELDRSVATTMNAEGGWDMQALAVTIAYDVIAPGLSRGLARPVLGADPGSTALVRSRFGGCEVYADGAGGVRQADGCVVSGAGPLSVANEIILRNVNAGMTAAWVGSVENEFVTADVPEPAGWLLAGPVIGGLIIIRRRVRTR